MKKKNILYFNSTILANHHASIAHSLRSKFAAGRWLLCLYRNTYHISKKDHGLDMNTRLIFLDFPLSDYLRQSHSNEYCNNIDIALEASLSEISFKGNETDVNLGSLSS